MRTHVFLTPMTPDGKPGEVRELSYNDEAPRQFMAPTSYTEHDAHTRAELETERDGLLAELPKLKGAARSKADHRIRVLEREIRRALDVEETDRRNAERQKERQRQQPGVNLQTVAEQVASVAAAVNAVTGKASTAAKRLVRECNWDRFVASLNTNRPVRPAAGPAGHSAAVCCEGKYLCGKCQAKKAAAA